MLKKGKLKFQEIDNPTDMIKWLSDYERLQKHRYLYRYCSFYKAQQIINEKRWHFSSPRKMNDGYEYEKYNANIWNGKYYLCFMETDHEEISMWSMYGQPWKQGVRIGISTDSYKKWIKNTKHIYRYDGTVITDIHTYFADVLYFEDGNPLTTGNNKKNRVFNPYAHDEMAGFVKDVAWSYEKECRFHIDVAGCNDEGILVDVPDYVIDSMIITTSPRFELDGENDIKGLLGERVTVAESKFTNRLTWVYCDDCTTKRINK